MGKAEKGTPKYLANKMKAKGLQKLRWYCQMCQKQCRDENGFKCHTMSESHQRQLLLFAENPDKYLDSFSEDFYKDFISLLKRQFGTKRVMANNVYQEYIHDKEHIHMNATQWETLTDFVKWLGREGHCTVDETEKGWFIAYIDRDPETIMRQEKLARNEKHEFDSEKRRQEFLEKQIKLGLERAKNIPDPVFTDLKRDSEDPIKLNLSIASSSKITASAALNSTSNQESKSKFKKPADPKRKSALAEIIEEEERKKMAKMAETPPADLPWLADSIVVKVITKNLGSKYYKQKGVVLSVTDGYTAKIKLLECGTKMKLDQAHLETVVPSVGRPVMIVGGKYRGREATLESLQIETFSATLKLANSSEVVERIPYECFSKLMKK